MRLWVLLKPAFTGFFWLLSGEKVAVSWLPSKSKVLSLLLATVNVEVRWLVTAGKMWELGSLLRPHWSLLAGRSRRALLLFPAFTKNTGVTSLSLWWWKLWDSTGPPMTSPTWGKGNPVTAGEGGCLHCTFAGQSMGGVMLFFCGVWLEENSHCPQVFCLARLPLSWTFD